MKSQSKAKNYSNMQSREGKSLALRDPFNSDYFILPTMEG